jgi:hypothetical protein
MYIDWRCLTCSFVIAHDLDNIVRTKSRSRRSMPGFFWRVKRSLSTPASWDVPDGSRRHLGSDRKLRESKKNTIASPKKYNEQTYRLGVTVDLHRGRRTKAYKGRSVVCITFSVLLEIIWTKVRFDSKLQTSDRPWLRFHINDPKSRGTFATQKLRDIRHKGEDTGWKFLTHFKSIRV